MDIPPASITSQLTPLHVSAEEVDKAICSFPWTSYSAPSSLFIQNKTILSAKGVQQGDPLGPQCFPSQLWISWRCWGLSYSFLPRRWHPGWGSWGCSPWPTDNDRGGGKVRSPAKPLKIRDHQQWRECFSGNDRSSPRPLPCHPWECPALGFTHRRGGRNWWLHRREDHSTGDHGQ